MYKTTVMIISVHNKIRPLSMMPLTKDHRIRKALRVRTSAWQ